MAKLCCAEQWSYVTYHGEKSQVARAKAIKDFGDVNKNIRVLIGSLKAGGIGLNLTMAQRVIVLDPWFNSCCEQQAFGRVFRFGQKHETRMTRFVVRGTVDEDIIKMQATKEELIGQVMDGSEKR